MPARLFALVPLMTLLVGAATACRSAHPPVPPTARLAAMWSAYRTHYIRPSGEVVDPLRQRQVTSEAQSYALLRAVWMRDRGTFDLVRRWTDAHLRRPDGLYAWLWDPSTQRIVDANTATDADIDIAFALAMGSLVFARPADAVQARDIARAIRAHASLDTGDGWFPSAGNWAARERIVNLSYFSPYAFAWFHRLDPDAGWDRATAAGHALVEQVLASSPVALPADFHVLGVDGRLSSLPEGHMLSAVFSYDAIRIPWRLEMACRWLRDQRGCRASEALATRLAAVLRRDGRFATRYRIDGTPLNDESSISFEGALLPAFSRVAPELAHGLRTTRLGEDALATLAAAGNRYYDANWVWFGLAAADGVLLQRTPSLDRLDRPR